MGEGMKRRSALKSIVSMGVAGSTFPAAASAGNGENNDIPEVISIEEVSSSQVEVQGDKKLSQNEQLFEVEFENESLIARVVGHDSSTQEGFSKGKVYVHKDEVDIDDVVKHNAQSMEVIEDYNVIQTTGPQCRYVGDSDWEDYNHRLEGVDVLFTRSIEGIGSTAASAAVAALLGAAGLSWPVTVSAAVIVGVWIALSGPRYYVGNMDVDRGCISDRCGFRTIEPRWGDGSVKNPDWNEFDTLTTNEPPYPTGPLPVESFAPGHIGSP
ncbi:hypothetical protein [Natrarchaeobius oligotrophus]|uniref:hypothetical protein n=1 Tax=Natrarchaeobius oligotrophus TaxID=3455743 RepID=UPI000F5324EA|nr:hypothetical protein [Natrarchaeobius chitinivorans]